MPQDFIIQVLYKHIHLYITQERKDVNLLHRIAPQFKILF